jgi:arylsulfatase A-like enzyme
MALSAAHLVFTRVVPRAAPARSAAAAVPAGAAALRLLARLTRIGVYPPALALALAQIVMLAVFFGTHRERLQPGVAGPLVLLLSLLPGPALVALIHLVGHGRRVLVVALDALVVALYAVLYAVHFDTRGGCDYALLHDNFREIFFSESAGLIFAAPAWCAVAITTALVAAMVALESRVRLLSRWERPARHRARILGCAALCLGLAVWPPHSHDEVGAFARSVEAYYLRGADDAAPARGASLGLDPHRRYPYVRQSAPGAAPPARPHVFVIAVESFNGNFAGARTPDGREHTPFFNRLIDRGVYVQRFYGNSIQTERGHFSILCSTVPSTRKKVAVAHPGLSLHCLPEVLREAGYETSFFTGQATLDFDKAGEWMTRQGFSRVQAMDRDFTAGLRPDYRWGWGLQDDLLYRKVLEAVDGPSTAPRFVFIAPVSNHNRFDDMPPCLRQLYPRPTTGRERYANSLYLADRFLATFFTELERRPHLRDSVVVVTGDHGFPAAEHGNTWNEFGAYEENFRTPLLVIWPGHLQPRVIADRPASQLDIAPTIVELLGLGGPTHFLGRSVLTEGQDRVIPLVQPYDGTHLVALKGPLKLVRHVRTRTESLYDLDHDPAETTDLIGRYRGRRELEELRDGVALIQLNQTLLETDRIWPR